MSAQISCNGNPMEILKLESMHPYRTWMGVSNTLQLTNQLCTSANTQNSISANAKQNRLSPNGYGTYDSTGEHKIP